MWSVTPVADLERSLRDALRDDRWALPARPDEARRLRTAARIQRMRRRAVVAVACVAAVVAVSVPFALAGHGGRASLTTSPPAPSGTRSLVPSGTASLVPSGTALPPPGGDFPASVYPQPVRASGAGSISGCPDPEGLQRPVVRTRAEVVAALTQLARGTSAPLDDELTGLDRAEWSQYAASRRYAGPAGSVTVLYAAPLLAGGFGAYGPPDLAGAVSTACGAMTAADSYAAVEGPAGEPALQEVVLFVRRGGRLLAYAEYP